MMGRFFAKNGQVRFFHIVVLLRLVCHCVLKMCEQDQLKKFGENRLVMDVAENRWEDSSCHF